MPRIPITPRKSGIMQQLFAVYTGFERMERDGLKLIKSDEGGWSVYADVSRGGRRLYVHLENGETTYECPFKRETQVSSIDGILFYCTWSLQHLVNNICMTSGGE
jgi:hypothetical protein